MAEFSKEAIAAAQASQEKYGVPASVTLAQYALESNYGKSYLAKSRNNYFGVKDTSGGGYASYDSMADSFDAHGALLAKPLYATKTASATSAGEYVDAIAGTYAEDPAYSTKVKNIIQVNNLTQYDTGATVATVALATTSSGTQSTWEKILSGVITGAAYIFLVVLAVVCFVNAFNIQLPGKAGMVQKVVKAAT